MQTEKTPQPTTDIDPESLVHLHFSEWAPAGKGTAFVVGQLCKLQDKEVCSCLLPFLGNKVAVTLDTKCGYLSLSVATFLGKYVRNAKKGIDRSW